MIKFASCILLLAAGCALTDAASLSDNVDSAFFRLFNRNGPNVDVSLAKASELVPLLNKTATTVFYIHGHMEYIEKDTVTPITDALLNYTTNNIIGLDYRSIAMLIYPTSVAQAQALGVVVANSIKQMVDAGLKAENIYIIGHSLGAQLAGNIGRNLPFKIPRITGLDPAGPLFYFEYRRLSASDAQFVDIIHTDAGVLGLALSTGSADFYPNLGHGPQPGCKLDIMISETALCSHHRSWMFFIESLKNKDAFVGVRCNNEVLYTSGVCDGNRKAVMGYYASTQKTGVYFLRTGANEPYGLGVAGAPFKSSS
nr:PREDICTED: pancreatic lipase-related protein 2-like [Megachile rotundata]XP_012138647.1 PREDICTED: pancreatic lipase-related protein 2-like [Megachile rotundata]XP_012138648.1 PREDICTED: pancreatic lipase-related protein 2-like [Megachile rotundata]